MPKKFDTRETHNEYPNMLWAIASSLDYMAEGEKSDRMQGWSTTLRRAAHDLHDAELRLLRQRDQLQKYRAELSEMVNELANGGGR